MARAKNVDRSEARRRFREARAAEIAAARAAVEDGDDEGGGLDPVTGRPLAAAAETAPLEAEQPGRRGFRLPDFRADIAAVPTLFRTRKRLFVPFLLVLAGFLLTLAQNQGLFVDATSGPIVATITQLTLDPRSLLVFFLIGFLAPRASYIFGFLLGVFNALLLTILLAMSASGPNVNPADATTVMVNLSFQAVLMGTIMAAFAAWYRNFLRGSQERGRRARAEREAKQLAAKKAEARAAKRPARPAAP
ncbi:MAG: hypothetical protein H0W07_08110 [Chloroflexi bacterium]|nr:hypothetical protein [Chloroflexota bacterium]